MLIDTKLRNLKIERESLPVFINNQITQRVVLVALVHWLFARWGSWVRIPRQSCH